MPSSSATSGASPVIAAGATFGVMGGFGVRDRFYDPPEWRWVVTDLELVAITALERITLLQRVEQSLYRARRAELTVPSNDPRVNLLYTDAGADGPFPYVHEGVRLLFGWREEYPDADIGSPIYTLRFGGIPLLVGDEASTEIAATRITAYDPRQYTYLLPIVNAAGDIPQNGITFRNTPGSEIVKQLIENAQNKYGSLLFMAEGDVEETVEITKIKFLPGTSLGQAIDQMQGVGQLDFLCLPLFDPVTWPAVCATWNVYAEAGAQRPNAIFAWDMAPRSLQGVSNLLDGAQRANIVQFYRGQGGPPVTAAEDPDSVDRFGPYVIQRHFPGRHAEQEAVQAQAQYQLGIRSQGRQTVSLAPQPLRSPVPYTGFDLGDRVPVRWSDRLRQARAGDVRVYGWSTEASVDEGEHITQMELSPRGFEA